MSYQWNPADYNKHSAAQKDFADELIAKLRLQGDERVLDIGCGDGKMTAAIARLVPEGSVVGLDSSNAMIAFAQTEFSLHDNPGLLFVVGDAGDMSFAGEFDVVFSTAALHWVKNHGPVLAGIYRALKPGGRLLIQMGGKGNAAGIISVADQMVKRSEWASYFVEFPFPYGFYGPDEYTRWAEQAGLVVERAELIPKIVSHADCAALEGWFRTTWLPYLHRLPIELQPIFINAVVDRYVSDNPADETGAIRVDMVRLEMAGHKP